MRARPPYAIELTYEEDVYPGAAFGGGKILISHNTTSDFVDVEVEID